MEQKNVCQKLFLELQRTSSVSLKVLKLVFHLISFLYSTKKEWGIQNVKKLDNCVWLHMYKDGGVELSCKKT